MADHPPRNQRTLQVDHFPAHTLAVYLIGFVVVIIVLELVGRLLTTAPDLPAPELGGDYMLGAKYERLKAFAAEGPVDCLIVGSSVVQQGIEPETLSYAYEKETGKPIRCFNLGILGAAAPKIGWLTNVLANQYHPKVIIYGVTYRDFLKTTSEATPDTWTAYRLGNFNASGWLADSSYAYRYYATLRYFLMANPATMADREKYEPYIKPDDIPIKGWADPIHLNWIGAPEYSEWLGRKLAAEWGQ